MKIGVCHYHNRDSCPWKSPSKIYWIDFACCCSLKLIDIHMLVCFLMQNMFPRWYIRNFDDCQVRMVHLSYHDGEHYNSVRLKDDPCDGPARSIIIKFVKG
ncbi:variant 6, OVARIAN TUMOR DOMAIN-containing deubiquitinating enzyme 7 [Lathyrus oleraceus]|uniref:Variant 6, OVARIAN TUMOR DOMAIN-containing deubiquitinating enzyme 7 n=1 Tax=Pisum sativum TaxID=3888 RepID=A0A9D5ATA6_PEA|nr:variant 6, OVARIAN TUMOR DOMAIN-containing deubiquitinating enzyme 7 [Pisum sativum]